MSVGKLMYVLNLIINGIPSILFLDNMRIKHMYGFKPYYKWNTFNTLKDYLRKCAEAAF